MIIANYVKEGVKFLGKNINLIIEKYNFFNEIDIFLDTRTLDTKYGGCFYNGAVDDIESVKYIKEQLDKFEDSDIFIDCGANTGLMSLMLQKGKAIAIEPNPDIFKILRLNAIINGHKNIKVLNKALYDSEQNYELVKHKMPGMTDIKVGSGEEKTIVGDKMFKNLENIKLIKIDCEHSTQNVLNGFIETIKKHKPLLILEDHNLDISKLVEIGYKKIKRIGENIICKLE